MARGLSVFVAIGGKLLPSLNASALAAERRFGLFNRRLRLMNAEMGASMLGMQRNWGNFAHNVSMPAAIVTGIGARAVYEWSKVGNELQAVTQMSATARKEIEAVARALPGNPAENLSAALDLARTGFDAQQIRGTLATTVKLSRADSSVDQEQAADIMTNVMKGMKLPDATFGQATSSAERVANNLAFAAAQSSSDVRLMGESFKYAAPMAARLGVSIEALSGMFMTMADAGIKGSESGVALRSGMVRLLKPTKDAMAILAKYNMELGDYVSFREKLTGASLAKQLAASGFNADAGALQRLLDSDLGGAQLVQRISEAVADGIGDGAQGADLDAIADAVTAALAAGADKMDFEKFVREATAKGWNAGDFARFFDVRQGTRLSTLFGPDMVKNIERVRAAMRGASGSGSFLDKMYAMQMQGAVGPWLRMQQSFGNLFISMAESGVLDTVAQLMDRIAASVMHLSKTDPGTLKAITYAIIGLAALAPLGWALAGVTAGFGMLFTVLRGGWAIFMGVGNWLIGIAPAILNGLTRLAPFIIRGLVAAFAMLATPVGWAIILAGVAAALCYYFRDDIANWWNNTVMPWWRNAWANIKNYVLNINWGAVGMRIADSLTGGFASKLSGANWGNIAKGALTGMQMGGGVTGAAFGAGMAFGGKRARGGPVSAGKAWLVGEEGPEILVPNRSGSIIPNSGIGKAVAAMLAGSAAVAAPAAAKAEPAARSVTIQPGAIVINGVKDAQDVEKAVERALRRVLGGDDRMLND